MRSRVFAVVALCAVGACSHAPTPHLLRLEARNLRFAPPARVEGGFTRLRLVNRDPVWHEASLVRFTDPTATLEAYVAAARAGDEYPEFAEDVGGVGFLAPGDSADVLLNLEPGRYAVICWHRDHLLQGMGASFEAVGESSPGIHPTAAVDLELSDFRIPAFSPSAGRELLHVTNAGPSEHELAILRLEPGKTLDDFMAWRAAGEIGPPPARSIAGTAALQPQAEVWLDVFWTPGRYVLLCLLEGDGGAYHADLGMQRLIVVAE